MGGTDKTMHVARQELLIAAATGAVFGVLGYYFTRHIHAQIGKIIGGSTGG